MANLISVFSKTLAFKTASAFLEKEVVWDNAPFRWECRASCPSSNHGKAHDVPRGKAALLGMCPVCLAIASVTHLSCKPTVSHVKTLLRRWEIANKNGNRERGVVPIFYFVHKSRCHIGQTCFEPLVYTGAVASTQSNKSEKCYFQSWPTTPKQKWKTKHSDGIVLKTIYMSLTLSTELSGKLETKIQKQY